jgi:histidyl-tRNA synthetase
MRLADKLGAAHVIIIGEDEIGAGALSVRDMVAKRDYPRAIDMTSTASELRQALTRLARQPLEQRA